MDESMSILLKSRRVTYIVAIYLLTFHPPVLVSFPRYSYYKIVSTDTDNENLVREQTY